MFFAVNKYVEKMGGGQGRERGGMRESRRTNHGFNDSAR